MQSPSFDQAHFIFFRVMIGFTMPQGWLMKIVGGNLCSSKIYLKKVASIRESVKGQGTREGEIREKSEKGADGKEGRMGGIERHRAHLCVRLTRTGSGVFIHATLCQASCPLN